MNKNKINSEVTHGNIGLEKVLKELAGGLGGVFDNGLTSGNVYFVIKSSESFYTAFTERHQQTYADGTVAVHADDGDGLGIQAALDAVTANRDDYVIVIPSSGDYDLTVALTMSKGRTHLICPAGLGKRGLSSNAVRLHQNTASADMITVTADTVEIAGFFFKGGTGEIINFAAATRWYAHIHDNFFGMASTDGTDNSGIIGTGACYQFTIHDNYFLNYGPGATSGTDNDLAYFVSFSSASSGRMVIRDNMMFSGINTEVTAAIQVQGDNNLVMDNVIGESQAHGAAETGVITIGILGAASTACLRNYFPGVPIANTLSGPTADLMNINNYVGATNGTGVADEDS